MEKNDFTAAIQSFEIARAQIRYHTSRTLFVVSLVGSHRAVIATLCSLSGRYPDGNLIMSVSPFNNAYVKPYIQHSAPRMRSSASTNFGASRERRGTLVRIWNGLLVSCNASCGVLLRV